MSTFNFKEWKDIPGYEGLYQVSADGQIKSSKYIKGRRFEIKKQDLSGTRKYYAIELSKNGKTKKYLIHRLVALAFIGPRPDKHDINHIDGNKLNNHYSNLEYITRTANRNHAIKLGLVPTGTKNPSAKLNQAQLKEIFALRNQGATLKSLGLKFNVTLVAITNALSGKTYKNDIKLLNLKSKIV